MNLLKNKENRRDAEDGVENWPGRWMPDRPDDPTPPPKILPKQENEDGGSATEMSHEMSHEWNGRMFDHVDALMQPNNEQNEYESVTEFPHEMYMGHVSPECDDAKVLVQLITYSCIEYNNMIKEDSFVSTMLKISDQLNRGLGSFSNRTYVLRSQLRAK